MKIIENTKLINRNKKISKYSSYGALAFLAIGFYFTLKEDTTSMIYSLASAPAGLDRLADQHVLHQSLGRQGLPA